MITESIADANAFALAADAWNEYGQEDRIRAALGLTWGPLPEVQNKWLRRYHSFLKANLALPFEAEYAEDIAGYRQLVTTVTVVDLVDPAKHYRPEELGLLCRVRRGTQELEVPLADVELPGNALNSRFIEDYWYWFWNWRFEPMI
jgi:hypothetical protein